MGQLNCYEYTQLENVHKDRTLTLPEYKPLRLICTISIFINVTYYSTC
jgi:hypothetical protein